jgi:hypothetical protein
MILALVLLKNSKKLTLNKKSKTTAGWNLPSALVKQE